MAGAPIEPGSFAGKRILVAGAGVAGAASAEALLTVGAQVSVLDRTDSPALERLVGLGARAVVAQAPPALDDFDEVVVSPGIAPHTPIAAAALAAGRPIYSEPELAWRLRGPGAPDWLAVTGTNGKTTTTTMLAAILTAAGYRTAALGNIGEPLVFAAADRRHFDVLAVELSSFQLYWSATMAPQVGALLNLADDHLEWHGSFAEYAQAKHAIWRGARPPANGYAIGNLDDPGVGAALALEPGRRIGVRLGEPARGEFGVVDGVLVDFAVCEQPLELVAAEVVRPAGAHNISNALHAAALARAFGVQPEAVAAGLTGYVPHGHRNAFVATINKISYVDDSKATNPHAACASLTSYPRIVWIAGGQLKGVEVDDLVAQVADRLTGVVLLGIDRAQIAAALARHAPRVPVVEVARADDGAMGEVVAAAARLAQPGDTVLLAPAAASKDMFISYAHRGDAFAGAVTALAAAC